MTKDRRVKRDRKIGPSNTILIGAVWSYDPPLRFRSGLGLRMNGFNRSCPITIDYHISIRFLHLLGQ